MNVKSMTGFGKADSNILDIDLSLEIKAVNNRYLETTIKMPKELGPIEILVKKEIQKFISRGSLQVYVNFKNHTKGAKPSGIAHTVAKGYIQAAQELKDLGAEGELTLSDLIRLDDILLYDNSDFDTEAFTPRFIETLASALHQLVEMRQDEGNNLAEDLTKRIKNMNSLLVQVEEALPRRLEAYHLQLKERVSKLLADQTIDEARMLQEIGYIADKLDITEELVRFKSHNQLFMDALNKPGPHGKKLNFILQEMGREANTLGTKAQFFEIQHIAVLLKEEIETVREQVLNIE